MQLNSIRLAVGRFVVRSRQRSAKDSHSAGTPARYMGSLPRNGCPSGWSGNGAPSKPSSASAREGFEKVPAQEYRRGEATCQFKVVAPQAVQTRAPSQQEDCRQRVSDVAPQVGIRVAPALQDLLDRS